MKKFLLSILTVLLVTISVNANEKQDALAFFNNYVKNANSYSNVITTYYSPSAKIIRQVIKPDGTTANAITDSKTYVSQLKLSQSIAKMRGYKNTYSNIVVTQVGNGTYKISANRSPMKDNDKLKTYMIIKKQANGSWIITEEMMQTRQQIFLRYVK